MHEKTKNRKGKTLDNCKAKFIYVAISYFSGNVITRRGKAVKNPLTTIHELNPNNMTKMKTNGSMEVLLLCVFVAMEAVITSGRFLEFIFVIILEMWRQIAKKVKSVVPLKHSMMGK
jgi:hypothetical protein